MLRAARLPRLRKPVNSALTGPLDTRNMPSIEILNTPAERTEFSDAVYSMSGRALAVASRFEATCRALAILLGIRHQSSSPGSFSLTQPEDLDLLIAEITKRRLFRQIESVVLQLNLPDEASRLFHAARDDRNFVAHELAMGIEGSLRSDHQVSELKSDLAVRVRRLALADLAICLLMLIETREALPTLQFISGYADSVTKWVCDSAS